MQFNGVTARMAVPYFGKKEVVINELKKALSNEEDLLDFLDTPGIPSLRSLNIHMEPPGGESIVTTTSTGPVGNLILGVTISTKSGFLSIEDLSALLGRYRNWAKTILSQNDVQDWIPYIYPILLVWGTDQTDPVAELRRDEALTTKLVFCWLPTGLRFPEGMMSKEIGSLSSNFYRFSPLGALISDLRYDVTKEYISTEVTPLVANLRTSQAFFEALSHIMDKTISDSTLKWKRRKQWKQFVLLRESVLIALATARFSRSQTQLSKIWAELSTQFAIKELREALEDKIDVLDSILQRFTDERINRLASRLGILNIIVAVIGVLLAFLAIPTALPWLQKLIFGK